MINITSYYLLSCSLIHTLLTQAVKHGAQGIQPESVLRKQVLFDFLELFAVHMDQPIAFFTFTMEADLRLHMAFRSNIFKAGRTVLVDHIFIQNALRYQAFQLPIDRGLADGGPQSPEMIADICSRNVDAGHGFKVGKQKLLLPGSVLCSCIHNKQPPVNMKTVPNYDTVIRLCQ